MFQKSISSRIVIIRALDVSTPMWSTAFAAVLWNWCRLHFTPIAGTYKSTTFNIKNWHQCAGLELMGKCVFPSKEGEDEPLHYSVSENRESLEVREVHRPMQCISRLVSFVLLNPPKSSTFLPSVCYSQFLSVCHCNCSFWLLFPTICYSSSTFPVTDSLLYFQRVEKLDHNCRTIQFPCPILFML